MSGHSKWSDIRRKPAMTATPRTTAGRALLNHHVLVAAHDIPHAELLDRILAIEAEATPSEGLREALEHALTLKGARFEIARIGIRDALDYLDAEQARAALAAPATPPRIGSEAQAAEPPAGAVLSHGITDPTAPIGWQCGDPGCEQHGLAALRAEAGA